MGCGHSNLNDPKQEGKNKNFTILVDTTGGKEKEHRSNSKIHSKSTTKQITTTSIKAKKSKKK
jgi:hypothetical protein